MPVGAPYHGRIAEYPTIRVDAFQTPRGVEESTVDLYLLTHTHTDHTGGLDTPSFGQLVYCSAEAKQMLLKQERAGDRISYDRGQSHSKVLPWSHLRVQKGRYTSHRDLLRPIPINTPRTFQLNGQERVVVTAIDANHCPGSVMYLIEGRNGAVLHTGDMRAEAPFLEELKRNKYLSQYLATDPKADYRNLDPRTRSTTDEVILPTLEAIYLDTASLFVDAEVPSKVEAATGLVSIMALYPQNTRFFLNLWTWGYEDIMKAIARSFGTKIHVDRYKKGIYSKIKSDPLLDAITTTDPYATRFHACERFARCDCVPSTDRGVVYVNPAWCSTSTWERWREETCQKLRDGDVVMTLMVPLRRHSGLPELKKFVELFKPKRVVPNTLQPDLCGADWALIPVLFGSHMSPGGGERVEEDMRANGFSAWTGHFHTDGQRGASQGSTNPRDGESRHSDLLSAPEAAPSKLKDLAKMLSAIYDDIALRGDDELVEGSVERLTALVSATLKHEGDKNEPLTNEESPRTMQFLSQPSSEFLIPQSLRSPALSRRVPINGLQVSQAGTASHPRIVNDTEELKTSETMYQRPASSMDLKFNASLLRMPAQPERAEVAQKRKAPHSPHVRHSRSVGTPIRIAQRPVTPCNNVPHIVGPSPPEHHKTSPPTHFRTLAPPSKSSPTKEQITPPPHEPCTANRLERRASHRGQRSSLFKLIERCNKARRSPHIPTDRILLPRTHIRLATPSTPTRRSPAVLDSLVSSLPMSETRSRRWGS